MYRAASAFLRVPGTAENGEEIIELSPFRLIYLTIAHYSRVGDSSKRTNNYIIEIAAKGIENWGR
jgi:hypothetical protein